MQISMLKLHDNLKPPALGTAGSGAYDVFLPESVTLFNDRVTKVKLGFATEIPKGFAAIVIPRSSSGSKFGVSLANTCGLIDSDYRGEWVAALRLNSNRPSHTFDAEERILQFMVLPVYTPKLNFVPSLNSTDRNSGGFGSTGA